MITSYTLSHHFTAFCVNLWASVMLIFNQLAWPLLKSDELLGYIWLRSALLCPFGETNTHSLTHSNTHSHTDQITWPLWQISQRYMFTGHLCIYWNSAASSFTCSCSSVSYWLSLSIWTANEKSDLDCCSNFCAFKYSKHTSSVLKSLSLSCVAV